jgi:nucleoid-associated protein YgaU
MAKRGSSRGLACDRGASPGWRGTGLLVVGYAVVCGALAAATGGSLAAVRAPGPAPVDATAGCAAAIAAWGLLTWLATWTAVVLVAVALGGVGSGAHRAAVARTPGAARRLAAALLGASLTTTPVATLPALAADRPPVTISSAGRTVGDLPLPDRPASPTGWTPDRPAAPRHTRSSAPVHLVSSPSRARQEAVGAVVVRRGDSLWDLAERHLGPGASAADIAAEWPRWYAANRHVIGPDPDLLLPGERLVPPGTDA